MPRRNSRKHHRSERFGLGWGVCVAALLLVGVDLARAEELTELGVELRGRELQVSAVLSDAFSDEIRSRLAGGLEISFEYTIQLRRVRRRFMDKTVAERYVVVTAQYSNLSRMYKVTRRLDGAVVGAELTDQVDEMEAWMARLNEIAVFDRRDFASSGAYYVRVKATLQQKFFLLFVPADVETDWVTSERFVMERRP